MLAATSAMRWWAESAPPGCNRVKVSENLGATAVAPGDPRGYIPGLLKASNRTIACFYEFKRPKL